MIETLFDRYSKLLEKSQHDDIVPAVKKRFLSIKDKAPMLEALKMLPNTNKHALIIQDFIKTLSEDLAKPSSVEAQQQSQLSMINAALSSHTETSTEDRHTETTPSVGTNSATSVIPAFSSTMTPSVTEGAPPHPAPGGS